MRVLVLPVAASSSAQQREMEGLALQVASRFVRNFEVAEDCISTPTAVLIGADGLVRSSLALGGVAIKQLLSSSAKTGTARHTVGNPGI